MVGSRILPYRHAGDKNYWLEVIRELKARGHDVDVLSVTGEPIPVPPSYRCEFVRPIPVYLGGGDRFNPEHRWLQGTINYPSKTLSFSRIVPAIRRHVRAQRPDVIHFLSNYGPIMAFLRPFALDVPLSISANAYNGGPVFYDRALLMSFAGFDRIVPFSDAFRRRLQFLGMPTRRLETIRWAVDTQAFRPPTDSEREGARRLLGVLGNEKVVFWAGFLTQMTPYDLEFSVRVAELVLERDPGGWRFFFCFKPEHYDRRFLRFERAGITVGGTAELFYRARAAADTMLSPITDLRSTATPPLTWVECMALGIPIVTTPLPGAEEIVSDGVNGLLARTPEESAQRLMELFRSPDRLAEAQREARRCVEGRFSLAESVTAYVNLWSAMAARARAS